MRKTLAALSALALMGCEAQQASAIDTEYEETSEASDGSALEDEAGTLETQAATLESEATSPLTFEGFECTQDCSGHQAGYEWAEEQGITNPDDCGGKSESFIEGCIAYAEQQDHSEGDYTEEM